MLTRFQIACGACSCVAGIAAGLMRPIENNAPLSHAASLTPAAIEIVDAALAKTDRLMLFGDRWQTSNTERVLAAQMPTPVERRPSEIGDRHRHIDRVCGERGRRWFGRRHHRYWRCRR